MAPLSLRQLSMSHVSITETVTVDTLCVLRRENAVRVRTYALVMFAALIIPLCVPILQQKLQQHQLQVMERAVQFRLPHPQREQMNQHYPLRLSLLQTRPGHLHQVQRWLQPHLLQNIQQIHPLVARLILRQKLQQLPQPIRLPAAPVIIRRPRLHHILPGIQHILQQKNLRGIQR